MKIVRSSIISGAIATDLTSNPIQMRAASNEDRTVRHRHRRKRFSVELIRSQRLKLRPGRYYNRQAFFAEKINSSIGVDRRRGEIAVDTSSP